MRANIWREARYRLERLGGHGLSEKVAIVVLQRVFRRFRIHVDGCADRDDGIHVRFVFVKLEHNLHIRLVMDTLEVIVVDNIYGIFRFYTLWKEQLWVTSSKGPPIDPIVPSLIKEY